MIITLVLKNSENNSFGDYNSEFYGSVNYCLICHEGTFSLEMASECTNCPVGTYNNITEADECALCPADTFNNIEAQDSISACKYCGDGNFSPEGSSYCTPCFPLCKRCTSTSQHDCWDCWGYPNILQSSSSCYCAPATYYASSATAPDLCPNCFEFCASCEESSTNCQSCIFNPHILLTGSTCECIEGNGYFLYTNQSGLLECATCHPLCETCTGPELTQCLSCFESKNAEYLHPQTCACILGYYYESSLKSCVECNQLCKSCTGSSNSECESCAESAYSVNGVDNLCVYDCTSLSGYYTSGNTCFQCDSACETCTGSSNADCLTCSDSSLVQSSGSCVSSCPDHYYSENGVCYSCHFSCDSCITSSSSGCLSCSSGTYLSSGKCLSVCPSGTYASGTNCVACNSLCASCSSSTECTSCAPGYFMDLTTQTCVTNTNCPFNTFPDENSNSCESCDVSCLTCIGSSEEDCVICNYAKGYIKYTESFGQCYPLTCNDGQYVYIDEENLRASCKNCFESCSTCSEYGQDKCITCKSGLIAISNSEDNSLVQCYGCNELFPGTYTSEDGICVEICGDGKNIGTHECDDGNTRSGDGCSANCKIEGGYSCTQSSIPSSTVCISNVAPTASISSVSKQNVINIKFSTMVLNHYLEADELKNEMTVKLKNAASGCGLTWAFSSEHIKSTFYSTMAIVCTIDCDISGVKEKVVITFPQEHPIEDKEGNALGTIELTALLPFSTYISERDQLLVENIGTIFQYLIISTFACSLIPSLFISKGINLFWSFLNLLQLLYYIPLMNISIPKNFKILLTNYLSFVNLGIPFNSLPSWLLNPSFVINKFLTHPYNEHYNDCELQSMLFVYNFGGQFYLWIWVFVVYLIFSLLDWILPKNNFKIIRKIKRRFAYRIPLRIFLETYLHMSVCSMLNLCSIDISNRVNLISLIIALVALFLGIGMIGFSTFLLEGNLVSLKDRSFERNFSTLITCPNYRKRNIIVKHFQAFFMFRRFFYALLITFINNVPEWQIFIILFVALIPQFIYNLTLQPFQTARENFLNIFNEGIIILVFMSLGGIQLFGLSYKLIFRIGWIFCLMVISSLILTWVFLIPTLVGEIKSVSCKSKNKEERISPNQIQNGISKEENSPTNQNIRKSSIPFSEKYYEIPIQKKKHILSKRLRKITKKSSKQIRILISTGKRKD